MTQRDIENALDRLAILQYWPSDPVARKGIGLLLERIVDRADKLEWLVETMINRVGTWHGPMELRGVYCTRFKPADGIEANCISSSGFTAVDSERSWYEQEAKEQQERLNDDRDMKLLGELKRLM